MTAERIAFAKRLSERDKKEIDMMNTRPMLEQEMEDEMFVINKPILIKREDESMNDTQMERTQKNFGVVYPLPGTPCKKCGERWDEHKHLRENGGFDTSVCPIENDRVL